MKKLTDIVKFIVYPGPYGWAYIAGATIGITAFSDWSTPYLIVAFLVGGAAAFRGSALKNRELEAARAEGYTDGVREGFNEGYDDGRDDGYDIGYDAAQEEM